MLPDIPDLPQRAGGILLHPTSLPGSYGIGDLGPSASRWLDWMHNAGCRLWQILPLGPTGYADSPYQSFSAFAGNHLLISPEALREKGLIAANALDKRPDFHLGKVDYGEVIPWKEQLLDKVAEEFSSNAAPQLLNGYQEYCTAQSAWLDPYALFMALKKENEGRPWIEWAEGLRSREQNEIDAAKDRLAKSIESQKIRQFLLAMQWKELRAVAREHGITIIGDIPIFVAHDSCDVWSHPELFHLDEAGQPTVVAGVPPDYFSETGQRWGNPLYNWEAQAENLNHWWVDRFRQVLTFVDVVRLDHFRGFEAYWEIPASEETAIHGRWVPGPRHALLDRLRDALGGLPIIAEDLGIITEEVVALRESYELPGMKVMQFGFEGGPDDDFLPHRYEENFVAYTGTHDNDTSLGWYQSVSPDIQAFCREYLSVEEKDVVWGMIEALWASAAAWSVVPLQDLLGLGPEARMNFPSRTHGNWAWRVQEDQVNSALSNRLRDLNEHHRR